MLSGAPPVERERRNGPPFDPTFPTHRNPVVHLLRHLLRRYAESEWVRSQTYLDPYPADLMLRNVV